MDITTQRRFLAAIAGGLLVGAAGAIGWSLSGIDTSGPAINVRSTDKVQPAIATDVDRQPFDQRIAAKALRAPLYDQPLVQS